VKAFTIWQPWASLVMIGAKPYEFRPKSYLRYIGHPMPGDRIAIQAGARKMVVREIADLLNKLDDPNLDTTGLVREIARPLLERIWRQPRDGFQMLPLGAIPGTAVIGEPVNAATIFGADDNLGSPHDSDRGDFNWAWPLTDIEPFLPPVPARGAQGFWDWRGAP
jgi:hypothetical protein